MKEGTVRQITCFLFLFCTYSYGQIGIYNYKNELKEINNKWHKLILPETIYSKVSNRLSDIRIYGITNNNDTIEAPYLIRTKEDKVSSIKIESKPLNYSHDANGYYFEFSILSNEIVNEIKLDFEEENFDWKVKLEGKQGGTNWVTIVDDYRLLSIKNEQTNYKYSTLKFPNSSYNLYRLYVKSKKKVELKSFKLSKNQNIEGVYRAYFTTSISKTENKTNRSTEIDVDIGMPVSVNHITIPIEGKFDYYRPITIKYLIDSLDTEKGWKYNYRTLHTGTLNSIEKNIFKFDSKILQKLKIIIYNGDNEALSIEDIRTKGVVHELVARFTKPANYFLVYGSSNLKKPNYDITRFQDKIPENISVLTIGETVIIDKKIVNSTSPLFENKLWLWLTLIVISLLLGWFSIKMMIKK